MMNKRDDSEQGLPTIQSSAPSLRALVAKRRVVALPQRADNREKHEEHKRAKLRERRIKEFNEKEAATMHLFSKVTNSGWRTDPPQVKWYIISLRPLNPCWK